MFLNEIKYYSPSSNLNLTVIVTIITVIKCIISINMSVNEQFIFISYTDSIWINYTYYKQMKHVLSYKNFFKNTASIMYILYS